MEATIQQVIDEIIASIPGGALEETVDVVKTGDPNNLVTGIVTTFLASTAVIQQAIDLDANFIITHEPTFYNHTDDVSELEDNAVYLTKRKLIDDHGIVIWRFHDYWHRHVPDGIMMGLIQTLGWESYISDKRKPVFTLPETTVDELINMLKQRLGCKTVRLVGDPNMVCTNIALMPGSPGPKWQIAFLDDGDVDVLLTGEVHEWRSLHGTRFCKEGRKLLSYWGMPIVRKLVWHT